ncbi:hypothetical protein KQX54_007679 [Cotesia glomerata]|uniref:Uncharacterized protein n=1 Tax=Cotesia glomerata TaxID=32391 RepID=A0AAV7IPQ9_COTGL|nr:hypothetical protein KQX54_007679 [Cotesia glomerata]
MWTGVEECGCWDETNENEMSALALEFKYKVLAPPQLPTPVLCRENPNQRLNLRDRDTVRTRECTLASLLNSPSL